MWAREVRAVTFGDIGVLRRAVSSEALEAAVWRALDARQEAVPEAFMDAWDRATRRRDEARWSELAEEPWEATLDSFLPERTAGRADLVARTIEALAPAFEWFPDALPTLDFLHEAGYRIGIVRDSAMPFGTTWRARVSPWVDVLVCSRDVGRVKPHAAIFREALSRFGALPRQVLHVGDQLVADVFGAKALGERAALLERVPREPQPAGSFTWLKRVHGIEPADVVPDLRLGTLEEIPPVLEEFG